MIRGWIASSGNGHGPIGCVGVRQETFVHFAVFVGEFLVAELGINQGQIIMCRQILRIESESLLELIHSLEQKPFLSRLVRSTALQLGSLEQGLSKLVNDLVVLAKIEPALFQLRITVFENAAEFNDSFIQESVLLIY